MASIMQEMRALANDHPSSVENFKLLKLIRALSNKIMKLSMIVLKIAPK